MDSLWISEPSAHSTICTNFTCRRAVSKMAPAVLFEGKIQNCKEQDGYPPFVRLQSLVLIYKVCMTAVRDHQDLG